jgi:hypothetical protein
MAQLVKKVNNFIDFLDKLWYETYMVLLIDKFASNEIASSIDAFLHLEGQSNVYI